MSAAHLSLGLTAGLLLALLALGLSLQLGADRAGPGRPHSRRARARWPHHALFCLVVSGTALSGMRAARAGARGWALLPALALLLAMPRTRPGQAKHWRLALLCALAYTLGAWGAW
jgi:cytochrome b561